MNLKKLGATLIPFSIFTKLPEKVFGEDWDKALPRETPKTTKCYFWANSLISIAVADALISYGILSLSNCSFNYKKWPEIQQQREEQEERDFRRSVEDRFYLADDGDGRLSFEEFYEMRKAERMR